MGGFAVSLYPSAPIFVHLPVQTGPVNKLHFDFLSKLNSSVDKKKIYFGYIGQGFGLKIPPNEYLVIFNEWWVIYLGRR